MNTARGDDVRLAWLTSPAVRQVEAGSVVILPTGAVEQHGPHLPLGTDALLAEAIATAVAKGLPGVLVAEPLAYGSSWHHTGFAGTVTVRPSTFVALVIDVCESLAASRLRPVVLNGHAGNKGPLQVALAELAPKGVRVPAWSYFDLLGDRLAELVPDHAAAAGHAGALETSLVAHLWPEAVDVTAIPSGGTPPTWPDPHMFAADPVTVVRPFEELNPTGVVGIPAVASAEIGAELFRCAVDRCKEVVARVQRSGPNE